MLLLQTFTQWFVVKNVVYIYVITIMFLMSGNLTGLCLYMHTSVTSFTFWLHFDANQCTVTYLVLHNPHF